MDEITDRVFTEINTVDEPNDDPSLLTIILDISPKGWFNIKDQTTIQEVTKSLLVFLNAHLSLNNSNEVAFITSSPTASKFLHPNPNKNYDERLNTTASATGSSNNLNFEKEPSPSLINKGMYRQFRIVDEAVLQELNDEIIDLSSSSNIDKSNTSLRSTLSGALSIALTYTNRMLTLDQSISTTTASAIDSTTNSANISSSGPNATGGGGSGSNNGGANSGATTSTSLTSLKSRILIVSPNDDDNISYIPIMNAIFAAQKMKLSIDVAKLGYKNSSYLQQASDATNGIYLHIEQPQGLIQTLCTAFFIEPSIRPLIILPTNSNVNYRASCFLTGKSVDLGFVCSVCLCIMSVIPESGQCPTCKSNFDDNILNQLRRSPVVSARKKRKTES